MVREAVKQMRANLSRVSVPHELVSQFLPQQYERVRAGELELAPAALLRDKIREVLDDYLAATVAKNTAG